MPDNLLRHKQPSDVLWNTNGGKFTTSHEVELEFKLPEFCATKDIKHSFAVDDTGNEHTYDVIIGRDLLNQIGMDILYSKGHLVWDGISIPMKSAADVKLKEFNRNTEDTEKIEEIMHMFDDYSDPVLEATSRATEILDADYSKTDIDNVVEEYDHLSPEEKGKLKCLLYKYEDLFDGTLGTWNTEPVKLDLKPNAAPFYTHPYQIPRVHEQTLRKEVERLIQLGVLKKCVDSEWGSPAFIIPKSDKTVRFVTDFRKLNSMIKRKPYPLPKIQDLLKKMVGFQYATAIDISMGYWHIELDPTSQNMCTIVLPWGKYKYTKLPMGVSAAPDIFQEKMYGLMEGLEFVRCYLDDLLILSNGTYDDHLSKIDTVLQRLQQAGLKIRAKKCAFAMPELEYLGYHISRKGIKPIYKKVQAMLNIQTPKTVKQLQSFIGLVNYYRDMWKRRSHVLAPLSKLTKLNRKKRLPWGDDQQRSFEEIKQIIANEVILAYPDFNKSFEIHVDASDVQLGAVISQDKKPIAFFSRKLTSAQQKYTIGEREMLSAVETLLEFRNILLGSKITIYTDHMNNVNPTTKHASKRITHWRWLMEEFGPTFVYVRGDANNIADTFSRLETKNKVSEALCCLEAADVTFSSLTDMEQAELFDSLAEEETPQYVYPLGANVIAREQKKDRQLLELLTSKSAYFTKKVEGVELIHMNDKIYIPAQLRPQVLTWYHEMLIHPGQKRLELTLRQHLTWPGLTADVKRTCDTCHLCKIYKSIPNNYGHLPPKNIDEDIPWRTICVDLIGPYQITDGTGVDYKLWAMTMIDPATGWFEIVETHTKQQNILVSC